MSFKIYNRKLKMHIIDFVLNNNILLPSSNVTLNMHISALYYIKLHQGK